MLLRSGNNGAIMLVIKYYSVCFMLLFIVLSGSVACLIFYKKSSFFADNVLSLQRMVFYAILAACKALWLLYVLKDKYLYYDKKSV